MKTRNATAASLAVLALALLQAAPAAAQQAAAAAPAAQTAPTITGPNIPGMCAFSRTRAVVGSKVGQHVTKRLETITQQVQAELKGQSTTLENDAKGVEAQKASLNRDQLEQKQLELNQRVGNLQRLAQVREREVQVTEAKALDRIAKELEPLIRVALQERSCSVILDADQTILVAPSMDITPSVVQKLDAKITEFSFERERLDQQLAAQNGARPAQPAAAAPATTRR